MPWPPAIGDLLPRAEHAYGIRHKLVTYSLNRTHERGRDKARAFELALGIDLTHVEHLEAELLAGVRVTPVAKVVPNTPYGFVVVLRIPVRGVGLHRTRVLPVTTAWELLEEGMPPRMTSAYLTS